MTVMKHIVEELLLAQHGRPAIEKITSENYERWDREFVFDALKEQRYGQAFCNQFGVTDNILFYTKDINQCRKIIRKRYLPCSGK